MVKHLSHEDRVAVDTAIAEASAKSGVKIAVVVRPANARYQVYALAYGLALGSVVSLALWYYGCLRDFPALISVQLGTIALCELAHAAFALFVPLVPRRLKHHYAAQEAMRTFHILQAHAPHDKPFALLFVGLAERYVHVVTNTVLHRQAPEGWDHVTDMFRDAMRARSLRAACVEAIAHIAATAAAHFQPKE
jgi:uncharacterized membrane protein